MNRLRIASIPIAVALIVAALFGYRTWSERRFQAEFAKARKDLDAGHFALGRDKLLKLDESHPRRAEVLFAIGATEQALGRIDAALAAWERVPGGADVSTQAGIRRGTLFTNIGKYAPAEAALLAAKGERATAKEAEEWRRAWTRLLRFEGRTLDVRRALREGLATTADPAALLKELWLLDTTTIPTEGVALVLAKADDADERVKLGRAHLALIVGRLDEAGRRLDELRRTSPDDPAVLRARLDLAKALGDVDQAREAIGRFPPESLTALETSEWRAWFAARLNRAEPERLAWLDVVRLAPGHPSALDRLAALSALAGDREGAAKWSGLKAEVDRAHDRYRKILLQEADLTPKYAELERLARAMGRALDANGWALARAEGTPAEALARAEVARLDPSERPAPASSILADLPIPSRPASEALATRLDFDDDADKAGLHFTFDHGPSAQRQLPETMSGGVALLDYDGDGRLDVYLTQGGPFPFSNRKTPGDRLFRNKGEGGFEDATARAGLPEFSQGYGQGVAVGDYDGDGRPDLFVNRFNAYALLHNRGDGTFEDVTAKVGLSGPKGWPTSAAFADLDGDGDLDLYVCHYMVWDAANPVLCPNDKGEPFYCDPSRSPAERDRLYRNDGGKFVDATEAAGIVDKDGRGLGVVAADFNGDGALDLFVANDGTANFLFRNAGKKGTLRFEEVGHEAGVAANADGGYHAGMGVACGDVDGDGLLDLVVTNFFGEAATLYQGLGGGLFTDRTASSGLGVATRHRLGFGVALLRRRQRRRARPRHRQRPRQRQPPLLPLRDAPPDPPQRRRRPTDRRLRPRRPRLVDPPPRPRPRLGRHRQRRTRRSPDRQPGGANYVFS